MKMKKTINIKCLALMLGLFAMTASCTNDDLTNGETKDNKQIDGTVFVGGKKHSLDESALRTRTILLVDTLTSAYSFGWTRDDKIYLADGSVSSPLLMNYNESKDVADFIFRGKVLTAPSYDIYYPGRSATVYNKVNIPTVYNGSFGYFYNDSRFQFYNSGDCGFAKATKQPDGKYYFELEHMNANIVLYPYVQTKDIGESVEVKGMTITADNNIAGEFTLTENGLTGTGSSKVVKSGLKNIVLTGTSIGNHIIDGSKKNRGAWGCYVFTIAPTKSKIKIEYTTNLLVAYSSNGVYLSYDKVEKTFTKYIPLYEYKKNTITPITSFLAIPMYQAKFYVWDSSEDKELLKLYGGKMEKLSDWKFYSCNNTYNRSDQNDYANNATGLATQSGKNLPNRVEATWYAAHGDPHWDENYIWTNGRLIYRGGLWLKKKSEIPGFNSTNLPTDVAYSGNEYANTSIKRGTPTDTTKYFFLPMQGEIGIGYGNSVLLPRIGISCGYWLKDAYNTDEAWVLYAAPEYGVHIKPHTKRWSAYPLWTVQ